jgi:plasmid maintenance system antidote protein VapI
MLLKAPSKTALSGQALSDAFCEDLRRLLRSRKGVPLMGTAEEIIEKVIDSSARLNEDVANRLVRCFAMRVNASCRRQLGMNATYDYKKDVYTVELV